MHTGTNSTLLGSYEIIQILIKLRTNTDYESLDFLKIDLSFVLYKFCTSFVKREY